MSRLYASVFAVTFAALIQLPAMAQTSDTPQGGSATWSASENSSSSGRDDSAWSARGAVGFTAQPGTFLMSVEVPWRFDKLFSVGPLIQLGVADDEIYFAPTLQVYLHPPLGDGLEAIQPYAHAGVGLAYLERKDRAPGRDEEDADFQFTAGLGVEYELRKDFFMGTGMLFNVVPGGAAGKNFVFGWQLLTFRHAF
jgi:hypothetical protein